MLNSFDTKEDFLRFVASDQTDTRYLLLGGFQRMKRWCAIPLKPLTFLYGPNSAGKGAVIDAHNLIGRLWRGGDDGVSRWHRKEDGIPLSVGLSREVSLYDMYHRNDSAFEQYTWNYDERPAFAREGCQDLFTSLTRTSGHGGEERANC